VLIAVNGKILSYYILYRWRPGRRCETITYHQNTTRPPLILKSGTRVTIVSANPRYPRGCRLVLSLLWAISCLGLVKYLYFHGNTYGNYTNIYRGFWKKYLYIYKKTIDFL
jgi:hypothetical protein